MSSTVFVNGTVVLPAWLNDVNNAVYAGQDVAGILQVNVRAYPYLAKGDGVTDDGAAINAAIIAAGSGNIVYLPPGTYKTTIPIVLKNGVTLQGAGWIATTIASTSTTDAVVLINPINSSTTANVWVKGIHVQALNLVAKNGCIADTGSSCCKVTDCLLEPSANGFGLVLDQSELWGVYDNYFAGSGYGIWLVNGNDRNGTASTYFTNRIVFQNNQFNVTKIQVVNDGGNDHFFIANNHNTGTNYFRVSGANGMHILGGEFENCSGVGYDIQTTKFFGAAGIISSVISLEKAYYSNPSATALVSIAATALKNFRFESNTLSTAGTVISGGNNCFDLIAKNNFQAGAGDGYTTINNYYSAQNFTITWTALGTAPSLGNGTLTCQVSRVGRLTTMNFALTAGTTTSFGTSNFNFSMPVAGAGLNEIGSVLMNCAGGFYTGVALADSPSGKITIFASNNTSNAASVTVPAAWAANSSNILRGTIQYTALNFLG